MPDQPWQDYDPADESYRTGTADSPADYGSGGGGGGGLPDEPDYERDLDQYPVFSWLYPYRRIMMHPEDGLMDAPAAGFMIWPVPEVPYGSPLQSVLGGD